MGVADCVGTGVKAGVGTAVNAGAAVCDGAGMKAGVAGGAGGATAAGADPATRRVPQVVQNCAPGTPGPWPCGQASSGAVVAMAFLIGGRSNYQ